MSTKQTVKRAAVIGGTFLIAAAGFTATAAPAMATTTTTQAAVATTQASLTPAQQAVLQAYRQTQSKAGQTGSPYNVVSGAGQLTFSAPGQNPVGPQAFSITGGSMSNGTFTLNTSLDFLSPGSVTVSEFSPASLIGSRTATIPASQSLPGAQVVENVNLTGSNYNYSGTITTTLTGSEFAGGELVLTYNISSLVLQPASFNVAANGNQGGTINDNGTIDWITGGNVTSSVNGTATFGARQAYANFMPDVVSVTITDATVTPTSLTGYVRNTLGQEVPVTLTGSNYTFNGTVPASNFLQGPNLTISNLQLQVQ